MERHRAHTAWVRCREKRGRMDDCISTVEALGKRREIHLIGICVNTEEDEQFTELLREAVHGEPWVECTRYPAQELVATDMSLLKP